MKKNIIALAILLILCIIDTSAQNRDRFFLAVPPSQPIIQNSLYSTISFMDNRLNKTRNQYIINQQLLSTQLSDFVNRITDHTSKNKTILLQLRNLSFTIDGNDGYSQIRATLYEVLNSQFYLIGTLDTEVHAQSNKNISAKLQEEVSYTITAFISQNLTQAYTDNVPYTLDDIRNIDSVEKESSQLYMEGGHTDGVYYTFDALKKQEPLVTRMEVKFKKDRLSEIKITDKSNGKLKKLKPEDIYAVVLDGQVYIAFNKKYYPVYSDNGNLLFDAEHSSSNIGFAPSFSVGIGSGGYRGGGIGLGVFTRTKKETVTYMIDHLNGNFIPSN